MRQAAHLLLHVATVMLLVVDVDAKKKKKKKKVPAEDPNDIPFYDLEAYKPEDSWLDLDTWNPMRVAEFITHLEKEFPDIKISGEKWKEISVTGAFLKTKLWETLDDKMLENFGFEDNEQKYEALGFSADPEEQADQVARFRARIDREYMRRRDAKFRKNLMKNKEERKTKAAKKLGLEDGKVCSEREGEGEGEGGW